MDELPESHVSPIHDTLVPPQIPVPRKPGVYWLKRFLACNPFYLCSAALLLFGVYRVSVDPSLMGAETADLFFNFSALQVYEFLLVITAIFLARRALWYDSTLLAWPENLLV